MHIRSAFFAEKFIVFVLKALVAIYFAAAFKADAEYAEERVFVFWFGGADSEAKWTFTVFTQVFCSSPL